MSLHNLAQHLQSAGRGEDKVLVHMTPKEVGGLQALAMANGGSLTINPETGLPEAGFLKSILPMIAGIALAPMTAGTSLAFLGTPMGAALTVGGITGLATGSLKQGLMAGLGAYGGAGIGAGLSGTGAAAANAATPVSASAAAPLGTTAQPGLFSPSVGLAQGASGTTTAGFSAGAAGTGAAGTGMTGATGMGAAGTTTAAAPTMATTQNNILSTIQAKPVSGAFPSTAVPAPVAAVPTPAPVVPSVVPPASAPVYSGDPTKLIGDEVLSAQNASNTPRLLDTGEASYGSKMAEGFKRTTTGGVQGLKDFHAAANQAAPYYLPAAGISLLAGSMDTKKKVPEKNPGMIRPYEFSRTQNQEAYDMGAPMWAATPGSSRERLYFNDQFTAQTPYRAPGPEYKAEGGAVEEMSAQNRTFMLDNDPDMPRMAGGGYAYSYDPQTMQYTQTAAPKPKSSATGFSSLGAPGGPFGRVYALSDESMAGADPRMQLSMLMARAIAKKPTEAAPAAPVVTGGIMTPTAAQQMQPAQIFAPAVQIPAYQSPEQQLGLGNFYAHMDRQLGAAGGYAAGGGVSHLGDYSDGGRLLKGPGDGVSDSIPAVIGDKQPARLADGEFVVPARIVSEIGNGSTEAGARKLYAMMDRVQKARKKTTGKDAVAVNTRADKYLPA